MVARKQRTQAQAQATAAQTRSAAVHVECLFVLPHSFVFTLCFVRCLFRQVLSFIGETVTASAWFLTKPDENRVTELEERVSSLEAELEEFRVR